MRDSDGYVIAKTSDGQVTPVGFVHGDRSDAKKSAEQMPSHYVLGPANYHDWR